MHFDNSVDFSKGSEQSRSVSIWGWGRRVRLTPGRGGGFWSSTVLLYLWVEILGIGVVRSAFSRVGCQPLGGGGLSVLTAKVVMILRSRITDPRALQALPSELVFRVFQSIGLSFPPLYSAKSPALILSSNRGAQSVQ